MTIEAHVKGGFWVVTKDGVRLDWTGKEWPGHGPWAQFAREEHAWQWVNQVIKPTTGT